MVEFKIISNDILCLSGSTFIGRINMDDEGYFNFHPASEVKLCWGQLQRVSEKLLELNGVK